jgi:FdhD protein
VVKATVKTSLPLQARKLAGGRFFPGKVSVVIEKELPISLNGRALVTASITPGRERDFVTGYLFGQGFIDRLEEIESLEVDGGTASVNLKKKGGPAAGEAAASYRIVSGGGRSAFSARARLHRVDSNFEVRPADIFRAMNILFETASLYGEAEGTHAAGLFTPAAEPICIVEDIGRHNTLDKVIGHALLNKIDCSSALLAATGRMSSEMIAKICRAGIPVAATKTAVTDRGRELGRRYGLTIIGFVRDAGTRIHTDMEVRTITEPVMKIYTGAGRVIGN